MIGLFGDLILYQRDIGNQHANIENFIDRLATQLDIQQMDDWYKVTTKIIVEHGGHQVLKIIW